MCRIRTPPGGGPGGLAAFVRDTLQQPAIVACWQALATPSACVRWLASSRYFNSDCEIRRFTRPINTSKVTSTSTIARLNIIQPLYSRQTSASSGFFK